MHSDVTKNPLVAVFAHPDDEFAVFPWLSHARRNGRAVYCVWLTDGGWGGQDVARRRQESVAVLSKLGVDPKAMHFLGEELDVPDGELYLQLHRVLPALLDLLPASAYGGEVLIPAWEGGHIDHDAGHLAGIQLAAKLGAATRQFSLYHGQGLSGPWFKVLDALPQNGATQCLRIGFRERIAHVVRCLSYASQWKSFVGLMPFYAWRLVRADAFALQPVDTSRTSQRPHEGALLYERRGGPDWDKFASVTRVYRELPRHERS